MSGPVYIGVLDSGVTPAYQHLVTRGARFTHNSQSLEQDDHLHDYVGHGTAITCLIADTAPGAKIIHAQVFGERFTSSPALVAAGLDWLRDQRVNIVNMSFGMPEERSVLRSACERAIESGLLLIASAPAQGPTVYPAGWPGIISVTGDARCSRKGQVSDLLGQQADFGVWCASPEQGGGDIAGSSIAAAHFTGLAANYLTQNPAATRDQTVAALRSQATYCGPEQRLSGSNLS